MSESSFGIASLKNVGWEGGIQRGVAQVFDDVGNPHSHCGV